MALETRRKTADNCAASDKVQETLSSETMNSKFIGDGAPIKNVELRSPDVPCDDPEQMIRAIDLELQNRAVCRGKRNPRRTHRSYGIVGIVLMIAAALIALQVLISHMHALSERLNESQNYEAVRH